jgi:hypothetical protein
VIIVVTVMSSLRNLQDLPEEVLFYISLFLSTRDVWYSLRLVSQRLCNILSRPKYWCRRSLQLYGVEKTPQQIMIEMPVFCNWYDYCSSDEDSD